MIDRQLGRGSRCLGIAAASLGLFFVQSASAEGPRVHARAGAAHAVGSPQADDFGIGAAGALSVELPLASIVSANAEVGTLLLSPKAPPPGRPERSLATVTSLTAGGRFHLWPSKSPGGPWVGLGAGLVLTGSDARFGANGALGWDFLLGSGRWGVGPFVGYTHVLEPGTAAAQSDAHLFSGGVQVSFGSPRGAPVPEEREVRQSLPPDKDADGDGIGDTDDACPTVKGVPTNDLNTNGCPRQDADKDGVPDDEDACPNLAGEKRPDPRMNGCPDVLPPKDDDRDNDGIPTSKDACPDEAGKPSDDPKKNGCPPDADLELD